MNRSGQVKSVKLEVGTSSKLCIVVVVVVVLLFIDKLAVTEPFVIASLGD